MIVPDALILLFDLHVSVEVALLFHRWIQSSIIPEDPLSLSLSLSLPFCVLKIFSHPLTRCHHHNQRHGHLPCHNEVITTFLMQSFILVWLKLRIRPRQLNCQVTKYALNPHQSCHHTPFQACDHKPHVICLSVKSRFFLKNLSCISN